MTVAYTRWIRLRPRWSRHRDYHGIATVRYRNDHAVVTVQDRDETIRFRQHSRLPTVLGPHVYSSTIWDLVNLVDPCAVVMTGPGFANTPDCPLCPGLMCTIARPAGLSTWAGRLTALCLVLLYAYRAEEQS